MPSKGQDRSRISVPSTLKRSPKKAESTYEKTLAHAEVEYRGDEARAHRAAWGAVKHAFKKTGDHWEPKKSVDAVKIPASADRADSRSKRAGGVHATQTKAELLADAQRLGVHASMRDTKSALVLKIKHVKADSKRVRQSSKNA